MTREEAIIVMESHKTHWQRLLKEKICDETEGKETIESFELAISALSVEPCDDCISRTDAINGFEDCSTQIWSDDTIKYLKSLPSVQSMRPKGYWIKTISENGVTSAVRCSECGFEDNRYMLFRYCPNCGTDMRGKAE